jgi:NitT/TauT family transport system substrate-binding protein
MRIASPRRVVATVTLGVLPLVLAAACGGSSGSTGASGGSKLEKTTIVVGGTPTEANAPLYLAIDHGFFKKHGLNVKLQIVQSSTTLVPSMLHGSIDIAAGQIAGLIAAEAAGAGQFKVLGSGLELTPGVNEILAMKSSKITSVADLKGKTIAVNSPSGNGPLLIDSALAAANLKPNAIKMSTVAFPAMGAALAAGRVDAVYETQPYVQDTEQTQGAQPVVDLNQGAAQGLLIAGFVATSQWVKKYPNTAKAFIAAITEGSKLADTNLAAVQQTLEKNLKIPANVVDVMATGTFPTSVDLVKLQQVEQLMLRYQQLKKPFDVSSMIVGSDG